MVKDTLVHSGQRAPARVAVSERAEYFKDVQVMIGERQRREVKGGEFEIPEIDSAKTKKAGHRPTMNVCVQREMTIPTSTESNARADEAMMHASRRILRRAVLNRMPLRRPPVPAAAPMR